MRSIPDSSVHMILCDLPYGTTPLEWDKFIDTDLLWREYKRISKGAILLFGQEPFSSMLRLSNLDWYKFDWYWEKERLTNVFQVKRRPGKTIETISTFYNEQPTYNPQKNVHYGKRVTNKIGKDARWSDTMSTNKKIKPFEYNDDGFRHPTQMLYFARDQRPILHPTQKPVALLEYLIKTYSNEGNIVLDNTMGSGSTGVAAINTKRRFFGIEKEQDYYDIACRRIKEAARTLF